MHFSLNPEFGNRMVTLMAALVLVLQLAMTAQRWLVTNIRIFGLQSFLLAAIAATIGVFRFRFCWSAWWPASRFGRRSSRFSTRPSRC
jgi:hypothetical protein